jgi:isoleucyl-tRNA synthetase
MRGYHVERRFGWDTHGLPIEMLTESELGLSGRLEVLDYGVDKFNEQCRSGVLRYVDEWRKVTTRVGRWVDFDDDYKTMDRDFMESVWWVFKSLWEKGRIYEGRRVLPYSWRLATPLSNFEAGQNYKDVQDPAITVRFRKKDDPECSLLAWTTTPWTLPSNLALCVGANIDYLEVNTGKERLILAESRLESYFPKKSLPEIVARYKGSELVGTEYQPLFDYFSPNDSKAAFSVLQDDYVSTDDGTGIVHQAPDHGEDDYRICTAAGIALIDAVDEDGNFRDSISDFVGQNVKEADKNIILKLKEKNLLFKQDTIQHSYPFCERSETPLIYKSISAWYVKVEDIRERMQELNSKIHWVPEHVKTGRFGKWLEGARDWNISRNRFWGNPISLWRCESCGKIECMGSAAELEQKCGESVPDLHSHFVDKLSWACADCNSNMKRTPEVLDCWFESGSMPYAQLHYPFENEERFKNSFPADFIAEGLDQTRGWFYTLLVLSTSLFDSEPFENVVVNGIILAEDGKKMSKRLKNYPDPSTVIEKYGADALRLYLVQSPAVRAESLALSETGIKEIVRSVILPLWNAYSFFTTYAKIDSYSPSKELCKSENPLDKWILSKLQTALKQIEQEMNEYRLYAVLPVLLDFLEELTNWYVRRSRRRFWSEDKADKQNGYDTFYYVLTEFSKALAPFLPFVSEEMYQNLSTLSDQKEQSVHYCNYPEAKEELLDPRLESSMTLIQKAVSLGRALRSRLDIKIRQPLASITVVTKDISARETLSLYGSHIKDELNVKEVLFSEAEEQFVEKTIKPDFPKLGKRYGKDMKACAAELAKLDDARQELLESGHEIEVLGQKIGADEIQILRTAKDGKEVETAAGVVVLFDTEISEALRAEGLARELVNRVQRMRKDADFHISDRIELRLQAPEELTRALSNYQDYIKQEVLAESFEITDEGSFPKESFKQEHEIDSHSLKLSLLQL